MSSPARSINSLDDATYRSIFAQSSVSTQVFDAEGWTVAVNAAWERLWGITLEQLGPYNVLHDPQLQEKGITPYLQRAFDGIPSTVPAIRYEPERYTPDVVDFRWVRAWIYPIFNQSGAVERVVLMHEDITEQRLAEDALRQSETRFRTMFYHAPVGISIIGADGSYLAANPARQEMLGFSEAELLGRHYLDVTHPDDIELDQEINNVARERGEPAVQLVKRFLRKDGSVQWTRITAAAVRDEQQGEVSYSISIAEDITATRLADEARRRLEEQKAEFLSAVAHDLRTPLTTVRARAQMLQRRLTEPNVALGAVADGLSQIERSTARMTNLLTELLEMANHDLGRPPELTYAPTDLTELVRLACEEFREITNRHTVDYSAPSSPLAGNWDAHRLERVLSNLLSNAVKYSPSGGTITVTVERQELDGGAWAVLTVEDQGVGIPADDLPTIVERFRRGGNVTGRIAGAGIGLATVRDIVEGHGGRLAIDSVEGQGTRVAVCLPLEGV